MTEFGLPILLGFAGRALLVVVEYLNLSELFSTYLECYYPLQHRFRSVNIENYFKNKSIN